MSSSEILRLQTEQPPSKDNVPNGTYKYVHLVRPEGSMLIVASTNSDWEHCDIVPAGLSFNKITDDASIFKLTWVLSPEEIVATVTKRAKTAAQNNLPYDPEAEFKRLTDLYAQTHVVIDQNYGSSSLSYYVRHTNMQSTRKTLRNLFPDALIV